nr:copper chaperone PCu(A)C [uncultured Halomonas sp.]
MPSEKRNIKYRGFYALLIGVLLALLSMSSGYAAELEVKDARLRALPGDLPAAGYFTFDNTSDKSVVLVGAQSDAFGMVEMHRSTNEDGMAGMESISQLEVAPGKSLEFAPKGYHLMLMQPKQPLSVGDEVSVELEFEDDRRLSVDFEVVSPASM